MEDNDLNKTINDYMNGTKDFMFGLDDLAGELKNSLTDEQRKILESELSQIDTSKLKSAIDDISRQFTNVARSRK